MSSIIKSKKQINKEGYKGSQEPSSTSSQARTVVDSPSTFTSSRLLPLHHSCLYYIPLGPILPSKPTKFCLPERTSSQNSYVQGTSIFPLPGESILPTNTPTWLRFDCSLEKFRVPKFSCTSQIKSRYITRHIQAHQIKS